MKKQSFVTGAAILAAASILCKVLAAVFKIPLDRFFLHEDGIAVYQSANSVYNIFLAICITGIPMALSSLIARCDNEKAATYLKSTLAVVTAFCSIFAAVLFIFAGNIAHIMSGGSYAPQEKSLKMVALALPMLGITSASRGFFQGRGNMLPSALSQISESFIKAFFGILLCAIFVKNGMESGAAGAMAGVTLGAFTAAVILLLFLRHNAPRCGTFSKEAAIEVLFLSLPVTLGTFGYAAVMLADSFTFTNALASCGVQAHERLRLFGYLSRSNMVYNLPATVITAVATSAVPAVSEAVKNAAPIKNSVQKAVKLILVAEAPCAFGLMLFAKWIFLLLYGSSSHFELLALTGLAVLIIPYVQATTVMLQATGKAWKPIASVVAAILIKILLNYLLIPHFSASGAPIATACAFMIALLYNTFLLKKELLQKDFLLLSAKIILSGAAACTLARLIFSLKETNLMLAASIILAAIIYFAMLLIMKCITKEDFKEEEIKL